MYVEWPSGIIKVFKADMVLTTPIGPGNPREIYQLDTNWFRLQLKQAEDDAQGMAWPDTHQHNTTVEVSGAILARVVEIINGYQVEFEDGQYAVNLVGSNNNIGDVTVVNQVSIRPSNSAGLQDLNSLQAASFNTEIAVALDVTSAYSGVVFPIGTRGFPVNNLYDAIEIANARGIDRIAIMKSMTLSNADWSDGFVFEGDSPVVVTLTVDPASNVTNCEFRNMTVTGTLDGANVVQGCRILDINYVNGFIHDCGLEGTITLGGMDKLVMDECYSTVPGGGVGQHPWIDMGGGGHDLAMRDFNGGIGIKNCGTPTDASFDFNSGRLIVDPTISDGSFAVRGICNVQDDSTGSAVVSDQTVSALTTEQTQELVLLRKLLRNKKITYKSGAKQGTMEIYDDDGVTVLFSAAIYEDDSGGVSYRGLGIERQERLE